MNLSKTDTKELIRILDEASKIISVHSINSQSTKVRNVARKCRLLRKKLNKRLSYAV